MLEKLTKPHPLLVLVPLLIGQLALLSLQVKDEAGASLLKRTVLRAVSPLLLAGQSLGRAGSTFWSEYFQLREIRNENEALKTRIEELQMLSQQQAGLLQQARRLQALLELRERIPGTSRVASIIGRSPSFLSFTLLLDRGANDGVRKDNAVIVPQGVVGRIYSVMPETSELQILLDTDAAAGALIFRTRTQGVINGRGSTLLRLNYILNQEDVQIGDVLVTSGLDSIYPKEIPIGQIVRVANGETVFKEIDVLPAAPFNRLEEVLILLDSKSGSKGKP